MCACVNTNQLSLILLSFDIMNFLKKEAYLIYFETIHQSCTDCIKYCFFVFNLILVFHTSDYVDSLACILALGKYLSKLKMYFEKNAYFKFSNNLVFGMTCLDLS